MILSPPPLSLVCEPGHACHLLVVIAHATSCLIDDNHDSRFLDRAPVLQYLKNVAAPHSLPIVSVLVACQSGLMDTPPASQYVDYSCLSQIGKAAICYSPLKQTLTSLDDAID